jgi:gamma-glutamyltranspeptidase/glutathione hydrolase
VGWQNADAQVFSKHVVVCQEQHAAEIGREILRQGGSALDAAVATAFALAVTNPAAGNIGGGGFLVAYLADQKRVVTIDFRETAPRAATPNMYLDEKGHLLPRHRAGVRAAGVPGTVRGLGLAHARYGRLPWKDLVTPAAKLARDGFPISATLARSLNAQLRLNDVDRPEFEAALSPVNDRLADFPESVAVFQKADGTPWRAGNRLTQPGLTQTLDRLAERGPDEFYIGETARRLADYSAKNAGLLTPEDLRTYRAIERSPILTTYRGCQIYGMGPPASGGVIVAQSLNLLERFDLRTDGPAHPRTIHRVTEALRRGFFTRATEIADPDFARVDIARLTSKEWASAAVPINERATPSAGLAKFPILNPAGGSETTHLSVLDASGSAVALTYTLEEEYGSKAVVAGAGFLLNNEMGDFNLRPGLTNVKGAIGTPANRIAPGKRMLSSQTPTVVLKDGRVVLVTGSPGGRRIPSTVLWVLLGRLEFGLEPRAAVDRPRIHHQWFPDELVLEGDSWPRNTRADLQSRGHVLQTAKVLGDAHTIVIEPETGRIHGVADSRRVTSTASGD